VGPVEHVGGVPLDDLLGRRRLVAVGDSVAPARSRMVEQEAPRLRVTGQHDVGSGPMLGGQAGQWFADPSAGTLLDLVDSGVLAGPAGPWFAAAGPSSFRFSVYWRLPAGTAMCWIASGCTTSPRPGAVAVSSTSSCSVRTSTTSPTSPSSPERSFCCSRSP